MITWRAVIDGVSHVVVGCPRCGVVERWVGYSERMLAKSLEVAEKRHQSCAPPLIGKAAE